MAFQLYYVVREMIEFPTLNVAKPSLGCSMFDLGFLTFSSEFAVVLKHGVLSGMFNIKELPTLGVFYCGALLCLFMVSTFLIKFAPRIIYKAKSI